MNRTTANEQLMELKLKEFEVRFTVKMEDLDETFQSIVRRQNNTERLVNVQHEESVKLIEKKSRELHNGIVKTAQESIKEVGGNWKVEMMLLRWLSGIFLFIWTICKHFL